MKDNSVKQRKLVYFVAVDFRTPLLRKMFEQLVGSYFFWLTMITKSVKNCTLAAALHPPSLCIAR